LNDEALVTKLEFALGGAAVIRRRRRVVVFAFLFAFDGTIAAQCFAAVSTLGGTREASLDAAVDVAAIAAFVIAVIALFRAHADTVAALQRHARVAGRAAVPADLDHAGSIAAVSPIAIAVVARLRRVDDAVAAQLAGLAHDRAIPTGLELTAGGATVVVVVVAVFTRLLRLDQQVTALLTRNARDRAGVAGFDFAAIGFATIVRDGGAVIARFIAFSDAVSTTFALARLGAIPARFDELAVEATAVTAVFVAVVTLFVHVEHEIATLEAIVTNDWTAKARLQTVALR
jgi:hypothetical protein